MPKKVVKRVTEVVTTTVTRRTVANESSEQHQLIQEPQKVKRITEASRTNTTQRIDGNIIAPINPPLSNPRKPIQKLEIEGVFGYSGDVKNSLGYNTNGDIVYITAALGIITDGKGHQTYHEGHRNDITSFAISTNFIATGDMTRPGANPIIRIWNGINGKLYNEIQHHYNDNTIGHLLEKEINILQFNPDGNLLVAIGNDVNHELTILQTKDGWRTYERIYYSKISNNNVNFVTFLDNKLFYVGGDKFLLKFTISNTIDYKKCLFGDCEIDNLTCGCAIDNSLLIGTLSGNICSVNDVTMKYIHKKAHTKAITTIIRYNKYYISCGKDENLKIYNIIGNKLLNTFNVKNIYKLAPNHYNLLLGYINSVCYNNNKKTLLIGTSKSVIFESSINDYNITDTNILHIGHSHSEIWGCSTNPLDPYTVVTVGDDKNLILWDIATKLPRNTLLLPKISRTIDYHPSSALVAIGLGGSSKKSVDNEGGFLIVNIKKMEIIYKKFGISNEWISAIKWSPDGKYLAVGSHDNNVYIYDTKPGYNLLYQCNRGASFVTQIDFSTDSFLIRVCYGDYQLIFYDLITGTQITNTVIISKKIWHTENCTIGWSVQGIWGNTSDKTDINACCSNPAKSLLVAVDDFSTVRLYRYPCIDKKSEYSSYYGHSSHIPYAEFTFNGNGLLTCGGLDHTVIFWKVKTQ